jgi:hypothetical protein
VFTRLVEYGGYYRVRVKAEIGKYGRRFQGLDPGAGVRLYPRGRVFNSFLFGAFVEAELFPEKLGEIGGRGSKGLHP